jgi:hypothetical protein
VTASDFADSILGSESMTFLTVVIDEISEQPSPGIQMSNVKTSDIDTFQNLHVPGIQGEDHLLKAVLRSLEPLSTGPGLGPFRATEGKRSKVQQEIARDNERPTDRVLGPHSWQIRWTRTATRFIQLNQLTSRNHEWRSEFEN